MQNTMTLSPEVLATLGRSSTEAHHALTFGAKALLALNAKAERTGSAIYGDVGSVERAKRRAVGKRQRAARRINRGR